MKNGRSENQAPESNTLMLVLFQDALGLPEGVSRWPSNKTGHSAAMPDFPRLAAEDGQAGNIGRRGFKGRSV
jgi:hypothetical protein